MEKNNVDVDYPKTWGGKVWWKAISEKKGYRIQQNMFSWHYRLLDQENRRIYASFNLEETESEYISCIVAWIDRW